MNYDRIVIIAAILVLAGGGAFAAFNSFDNINMHDYNVTNATSISSDTFYQEDEPVECSVENSFMTKTDLTTSTCREINYLEFPRLNVTGTINATRYGYAADSGIYISFNSTCMIFHAGTTTEAVCE